MGRSSFAFQTGSFFLGGLLAVLAAAAPWPACAAETSNAFCQVPPQEAAAIGNGDGHIHVIPTLSGPSVKNGGKLTISAVVKAQAGVQSVVADLGGIETITLKPSAAFGGTSFDGTVGLWSAEWMGHWLEEKIYTVTLRVTDRSGHVFEDRSLQFSDPAAGNSTPGTTAYPPSRVGAVNDLTVDESLPSSAVVDVAAGYAYFGTDTNPGAVVKVALGSGTNAPTRVGVLGLNPGESNLHCAVIDPAAGYAYFGTNNNPGVVVKIALGSGTAAPSRVGAVTFNTGENNLECAVIDPVAGYAYFGTYSAPGIVVKVRLGNGTATPTRVGALTLNSGENYVYSAVIDPAAGYAYFGTVNTTPGSVIKVALGNGIAPPTRVGAVTLNTGENEVVSAAIDPAAGYAYFGTESNLNDTKGTVVKVALGSGATVPTRVGAVTLNSGEGYLSNAVIDLGSGYAYFGAGTGPGVVVKVALGIGSAPPARVGALTLNSGERSFRGAVIDPTAGYAYFGAEVSPGIVVKVALGSGTALPTRVGALTLNAGEPYLRSAVIDPAAGYAYFGTDTFPGSGKVIKVALGSGTAAPTQVGSLTLNSGEYSLSSAVIDPAADYAYFGTGTIPGIVVKVALGNGSAPPTRVGALTLNSGEDWLFSAVIDPASGYAYFGAYVSPGRVIKVRLGSGTAAPTRVGAVTLNSGEDDPICAAVDPASGYAYFGTNTSPGIVVKVALGSGSNAPARVGALKLNSGENYLESTVIDAGSGYGYFGAGTGPAIVIKVALGAGTAAPTRVGALTLNGQSDLHSAVIDPTAGYAYFGCYWGVVKVALGVGAAAPARAGVLTLNPGENLLYSAVIDPAAGYAYFGTYTNPGIVVKTALTAPSESGAIKATKLTMTEAGNVTDVRFYSHAAKGNVRLAIYDNGSPKNLLWQSASIANSAAGAFAISPASSGTPSSLQLPPGTYWLGWQVDTNAAVPSYTAGAAGDGFYLSQPYGAFPGTITGETATSEKWTEYVTYTVNTATTVASSLNPSVYGQSVTFTATVMGAAPTGTVTFNDGPTTLGTAALNGGTATYTTSALAAGSHSITAAYGGDANNSGSTSAPLAQGVNPAPLTITADNKSKGFGAPVPPLTATFSGFVNGDTVASLTTPPALSTTANALSEAGTYPITASGAASANYTISYVAGTLTVNPVPWGKDMQVVVGLTIPGSVGIAWGAGTTGKNPGDVTPIVWALIIGTGEIHVSSDDLTMNLENTSNTGTQARVSGAVPISGGWTIGSTPAPDTFVVQAQVGTNPLVTLASAAQELTATTRLAKGADQPLVLTLMTPTAITVSAGAESTIIVVLTATPE